MFDSAIGNPHSENYLAYTTYNCVGKNPFIYTDSDGKVKIRIFLFSFLLNNENIN